MVTGSFWVPEGNYLNEFHCPAPAPGAGFRVRPNSVKWRVDVVDGQPRNVREIHACELVP